jgi:hypothetical protein
VNVVPGREGRRRTDLGNKCSGHERTLHSCSLPAVRGQRPQQIADCRDGERSFDRPVAQRRLASDHEGQMRISLRTSLGWRSAIAVATRPPRE